MFWLKQEVSKQNFFVFSFMNKKCLSYNFIVWKNANHTISYMEKKLILLFLLFSLFCNFAISQGLVIKQKYVCHGLNSRHSNFRNNRTTRTNYLGVKICRSEKGKIADPVSFVGLFHHICTQNHLKNGSGIYQIFVILVL